MRKMPMRGAASAVINATPVSALNVGLGFLKGFTDRYGAGGDVGPTLKRVAPWLGATSLINLHELSLEKWPSNEPVVPGAGCVNGRDHGFLPESEIDQLCLHDMRNYLPGDILAKVDRASMAVSLETRIPLLDPDVVRFAMTLPEELRMKDAKGKLILRETLKRYVPEAMFDRPKTGFSPPLESWLLGPLRGWAEDLLSPARLESHGLLDVSRVRDFWARYQRGGTMEEARLWSVLQLQSWMVARGL
jgi:asparagine synthase (glutamine-hydrolysing)